MKDFYAYQKGSDLWTIKEEGFHKSLQNVRESQLAVGNGLIGARGVLEEIPKGALPGTFMTGIYDRVTSQVAELVNLPNPYYFKFTIKGEKFGAIAMDIIEHERVLNMRDGLLLRRTIYSDVKKRRYDYQSLRFLSMDNKNIGVMQMILTPLDADAEIELQAGIDTGVYNSGTVTEGDKRHFAVTAFAREENANYYVVETLERHQTILFWDGFYYHLGRGKKTFGQDHVLKLKLKKNQPAVFTKVFHITSCSDRTELGQSRLSSRREFQKAFRTTFAALLNKHVDQWHKLWDMADVVIEGTADIQRNLRFNIYHMLACAHADDGASSIGARTLSGEGYRGHIFWDAEIFMLPFYAYVCPDVAQNMLLYRYKRINEARKIARLYGYRGAMFPWESAGTGEEETPTWAKDLDGKIIRIKTNELEHHITADIAYACYQYYVVSGDREFLDRYGHEMIFAAARFWASRVSADRRGKYHIRNIIGPDEFHEHVNNNAFTNMMAKWNLLTGHKLYFDLKKGNQKLLKTLRMKLNLTDKEIRHWKHIASRIVLKTRKDGIIEQFDGYFRKRHIEIVNFDENGIPLLPPGVDVREYNKTQFVKQADVVMLMHLLSDYYNRKTKENNYWFYVKRTLHKSSLSAAMHSLLALEAGSLAQAYQFFNVALRADISNLHGNTAEGIHAASLGGVWQNVVNGFAGIRIKEKGLSINPFMPKTWRRIKCSVFWQHDPVFIETRNNEVRVRINARWEKKVKIEVFGKTHLISAGKEYVFARPKMRLERNYYL